MTAGDSPVRRRRGSSMADVARLAGVSGQTVSRVANGKHNVDAATRDRVLAAMREVGYRPNSAARALRNGQFHSIGVIVFELSSFGNIRTLDAIATAATSSGYAVNLLPVPGRDAGRGVDRVHPARRAGRRRRHHPDRGAPARRGRGACCRTVCRSSWSTRAPTTTTRSSTPTRPRAPGWPPSTCSTWATPPSGTSGGPPSSFAADRRARSWRQTLAARGCVVPPIAGRRLVGRLRLRNRAAARGRTPTSPRSSRPTTRWRSGCCGPCTRRAARSPATSAWSVSTTSPSRRHFWPPLTTVRQSFAEVGRRSVDALIGQIQAGEHHHQPVAVPTELIVRSSTGATAQVLTTAGGGAGDPHRRSVSGVPS